MSTAGFDRVMSLINSAFKKYLPDGSYIEEGDHVETNKATQTNQGQITLYPYKINENEISIAKTHQQWLQLDLERDKDQDGESDLVVWYTLGGNHKAYQSYGKDVRNNYYIYTNGNVTYSGVGHAGGITDEEKKLFVNTIVAAYRASVKDPDITILENEDVTSREITTQFLPIDESLSLMDGDGVLDSSMDIFFKVNDTNFVRDDVDLEVSYYIAADKEEEGAVEIPGKSGVYGIPVAAKNRKTFDDNKKEIPAGKNGTYTVNSGKSYSLNLKGLDEYFKVNHTKKSSFKIYAVVETAPFIYYGETITRYSMAEVTIRKQQLFDLD